MARASGTSWRPRESVAVDPVPSCRVCASPQRRTMHSGCRFLECGSCGFAALEGVDASDDYWAAGPGRPVEGEPETLAHESGVDYWTTGKRAYFDGALEALERRRPSSERRLLDIGGGAAYFAERALARGWDAYSLDVSPTVYPLAAGRIGRDRAITRIDDEQLGSFDVVTLWCVVAHVSDPVELLENAAAALRYGGLAWITTPNFLFQRSVYARLRPVLAGKRFDFGAPDHVRHFTPQALALAVRAAGLTGARVHFHGVADVCHFTGCSSSRSLVKAKAVWNRLALAATRVGLPNYMSELQMTARKPVAGSSAARGGDRD